MSEQSTQDLIQQGHSCFQQGDFLKAISWFETAASQARTLGDDKNELWALSVLPAAWGNLSNYQKMIETATRLLARARQLNNENYELRGILRLARAAGFLDAHGRWQELQPLLLEGLALARRLEEHWFDVFYLITLGGFAVKVGEEERGLAWLQEALNSISPDLGDQQHYFFGEVYDAFSDLMRQRGAYVDATRYAEMAVASFRIHGNPNFIADSQLTLARAEHASGERAEALRLVEEVLKEARQKGWMGREREAEYQRGEIERELGHVDVAEEAARRALELAQQIQLKEEEVESLLSLGQVLVALGRKGEAENVLRQARRLSQERNYADHFQKAEKLLQGVLA